jgi:hypothetical protein
MLEGFKSKSPVLLVLYQVYWNLDCFIVTTGAVVEILFRLRKFFNRKIYISGFGAEINLN